MNVGIIGSGGREHIACSLPPLPIIPTFIYSNLITKKMKNKLAKLKYLPNKFEIIEPGDHVICAISKQRIYLQNLNYWNVELQEAYFSYKEAQFKRDEKKND